MAASLDGTYPYKAVYQFPDQPYTDLENIAVRSNGHLLLSTITSPTIHLLDPSYRLSSEPILLHTFPGGLSTLGIAETQPDLFAIVVGNYSASTLQGIKGSFAIWTLDLRQGLPGIARIVASIPEAEALNGATTVIGHPTILLVADSALGAIWRVDTTTGRYSKTIQNSLLAPNAKVPLGINGIRMYGSNVYFTNSAQGLFGRIPFSTQGTATGSPTVIKNNLSSNYTCDDFAIDSTGNAYILGHPNQLTEITPSGAQVLIEDNPDFDQPSSAAFGRTSGLKCTLYVATAGTATNVSGAVVAVQVC
jgi:hypothetical protein